VAVIGLGVVVWAGSQGLLGPHGAAKRLLLTGQRAARQGQWAQAQSALERLVQTYPDSPVTDQALWQLGQVYEQQQRATDARTVYQTVLERFPHSSLLAQTQARLGQINVALLFSPTITDLDAVYEVQAGDTLAKVAQRHQTTIELLKRANGLSADVIRLHQKLKVPNGRFSIVIDKSQNQLLLTEEDHFFKLYPVATGHDNSTPVGTFKIVNKLANPVWYRQGAVVPPDSPENILGTRWLGFDKPGYGIHGSVDPSGIGHQVTAGCVRMHNPDVEEIFAIVPMGTEVTIVD